MTDDSLIIGDYEGLDLPPTARCILHHNKEDYDVINRLKAYSFSLDEIKQIFQSEEMLFKRIAVDKLTMSGNPMVLFHSAEYTPAGLDTEFAIPVQEYVTGCR